MKRPFVAVALLALLALAVVAFWPRGGGAGGSLFDKLGGLVGRRDSVAFAALERSRDSLAAAKRVSDSTALVANARLADSLRAARRAISAAASQTTRHQLRVYALEAALAKTRDDDDSLPQLVALVTAQDSVITAIAGERDAALATVRVLERTVAVRDSQLLLLNRGLHEVIRQRDGYRALAKRCRPTVTAGYGAVTDGQVRTGVGIVAGLGCRL